MKFTTKLFQYAWLGAKVLLVTGFAGGIIFLIQFGLTKMFGSAIPAGIVSVGTTLIGLGWLYSKKDIKRFLKA